MPNALTVAQLQRLIPLAQGSRARRFRRHMGFAGTADAHDGLVGGGYFHVHQ